MRASTAPPSSSTPLRVLLVDDEPATCEALASAIRAMGHGVAEERSAARAIERYEAAQAASEPFDVVVCDWAMPGLSGLDLVRFVRSHPSGDGRYVYVVVVTAFADRAHALLALRSGADQIEPKPLDAEHLEARLLGARRVVSAGRRLVAQNHHLAREQQRASQDARSDPLTGALNRRQLDEDLVRVCASGRSDVALAIFDVDEFKAYNDALGHLAGDEALRRIVGACHLSRRRDDRLYRYGGEEFALLLEDVDAPAARVAVERLLHGIASLSLAHPSAPGGIVTVSAGLAQGPGRTPERWIERADRALYRAKRSGRARVEVGDADALDFSTLSAKLD